MILSIRNGTHGGNRKAPWWARALVRVIASKVLSGPVDPAQPIEISLQSASEVAPRLPLYTQEAVTAVMNAHRPLAEAMCENGATLAGRTSPSMNAVVFAAVDELRAARKARDQAGALGVQAQEREMVLRAARQYLVENRDQKYGPILLIRDLYDLAMETEP